MARPSLPGSFEGRTWTTVYVCEWCASPWTHVEVSPTHDEPHGLPFERRWCDCGGFLLAREDVAGPSAILH